MKTSRIVHSDVLLKENIKFEFQFNLFFFFKLYFILFICVEIQPEIRTYVDLQMMIDIFVKFLN